MADTPARAWPEAVKRWWLGSTLLLLLLLAVATVFVLIADAVYDAAKPDSFSNLIATDVLLNGVAVVALGALLALAVSFAAAARDRQGGRSATQARAIPPDTRRPRSRRPDPTGAERATGRRHLSRRNAGAAGRGPGPRRGS